MGTSVIVALPSVEDRVWKISSEKAPHLTIAYLSDVDAEAMLYVQHAAAQLSPFGLSVDYRGVLGEKNADVLFFEKNRWDIERVADFRHWLLQHRGIREAYDEVEQFPEWTPHLTLGYPETPAKEDDENFGLHYINFDRIAVWNDDYDGPEFRLKYDDGAMEVAMSGTMTASERGALIAATIFGSDPNSLKQYGKKGMKWGVRNDKGHEGEAVKTKKLEKLDKKWEADMERNAYMKMYNAAADKMNNGGIDKLNNSEKYRDVDFSKPENQGQIMTDYFTDHENAFHEAMVEAGGQLGMNPSGTKQFVIKKVTDPDSGEEYNDVFLEPVGLDLKHAEVGQMAVAYRLNRGADGKVTDYEQVELELAHYGVKGMQWGVTKNADGTTSINQTKVKNSLRKTELPITVSQKKAGSYVKAKGGQRHTATDDAIKTQALRQKAKRSTTDSLTNKELKESIERMRLEQEFSKLNKNVSRRGEGFVSKLLAGAGEAVVKSMASGSKKK